LHSITSQPSIFRSKREEDGKNINIVTRGGAKIGEDAAKKDQDEYQWVRKNTVPE
jgi:hypothetical protein